MRIMSNSFTGQDRFGETHRHQRRVLVHKVVAELANDVGLRARRKFNRHGRGFRA